MSKHNERERKLFYRAEGKELRIQKEIGLHGGEEYGYLISKSDTGLVLTGYNHWKNLLTLEEAEEFVAKYEG